MQLFQSSVELPVPIEDAFAYHERLGALQRLIPPWENVKVESSDGSIKPGARVTLKTHLAGIPLRWVAEHRAYEPPTKFEDVALSGPFAAWHHQHLFRSIAPKATILTDHINYQVPLGRTGEVVGGGYVRRQLEAMFAYRHRVTRDDLTTLARYPLAPRKIAVTGSSGLVGRELMAFLSLLGHQPIPARRVVTDSKTTFTLEDPNRWEDCDVVVHLAGKSIADKRWSTQVKAELCNSRIGPTNALCQSLAASARPPKVLICASAIGIYGNRGNEPLDESSTTGNDFLAKLGKDWEAACQPAIDAGIRVVNLRLGIILTPRGGALSKMLLPARLGLGGPMGSGAQWLSWVSMDDVLGAIYHAMATDSVHGPMNIVAPNPVTNLSFAKTLGAVLSRPAFVPAPAAVLRLALGEMADALLLSSTRVQPAALLSSGYEFRFPKLDDALRHLLGFAQETSIIRTST